MLPEHITIGDKYGPAMKMQTPEEAQAYFALCVEHTMRVSGHPRTKAEQIERGNLGYYAGYYDPETRIRVEKLFDCSHPIFGKAEDGVPTSEEALSLGAAAARQPE